MYNPGSRDVHEEACARKQRLTLEPETTTEETDMACNDCIVKDSDIKRLGELVNQRDSQIVEKDRQLAEQTSGHPSLADMLNHGSADSCPNCSTALSEYNERFLAQALDSMSEKAIADLAVRRGVMPEKMVLEVPNVQR